MPYTKNFRTPGQLTGIARGAFDAEFARFGVADLLPQRENFTLDYSFQVGSAPLPPAAKFRSFNTESMVNRLGTGQTAKGSLPPTSIRLHVDEYTQLKLMGQDDAIGAKFEEYAIANAQSIAFRIIIAIGQALQTGKVTLAERNLNLDIDFGRKAGLTANAAVSWATVATATPVADLEALRNVLGKRVSQTRLSRTALGYLQRNVDLMKLVLGKGSDLPSRVSSDDIISFLGSEGFGAVVVDEDVVPDTSGNEVPVVAADKVILVAGSQVGTTEIGVTTEAIESENGIPNSEAPGLFSGAIASSDPSGYDVYVGGILLPTLTSPNNTAVLDAF